MGVRVPPGAQVDNVFGSLYKFSMSEIGGGEVGVTREGPDWSDFGTMSSVLPPGSGAEVNPLGVGVKLDRLSEYREFYKPKYDEALAKSPGRKVYDVNNGVMAVLEKPNEDRDMISLKLVPLTGMSKRQLDVLREEMVKAGFVSEGLPIPHSSDGGEWISRCIRPGETHAEYGKRLRQLDDEYRTKGIKFKSPTSY